MVCLNRKDVLCSPTHGRMLSLMQSSSQWLSLDLHFCSAQVSVFRVLLPVRQVCS